MPLYLQQGGRATRRVLAREIGVRRDDLQDIPELVRDLGRNLADGEQSLARVVVLADFSHASSLTRAG